MKNKIIAAILLMGILWNGQMVYAEDTAVGEVIATESENSGYHGDIKQKITGGLVYVCHPYQQE